jgi:hypothetical protein
MSFKNRCQLTFYVRRVCRSRIGVNLLLAFEGYAVGKHAFVSPDFGGDELCVWSLFLLLLQLRGLSAANLSGIRSDLPLHAQFHSKVAVSATNCIYRCKHFLSFSHISSVDRWCPLCACKLVQSLFRKPSHFVVASWFARPSQGQAPSHRELLVPMTLKGNECID